MDLSNIKTDVSSYFKLVDELTFTDDYMFGEIMKDPEICAGVIERLLKIKVGHIVYPKLQKSIKPAYASKGVRFDVYVKDSDKVYDIELQNRLVNNLPKRMRYYQSMIDADNLLRGEDYENLPESYVIFICKEDPFGKNLAQYTFVNRCMEAEGFSLDDKSVRVVYNAGAYEDSDDEELKSFLKFVSQNKADDSFTRTLEDHVRATIESEKFRKEYMTVNLHDRDLIKLGKQDGIEEGIALGISRGISQGISQGRSEGLITGRAEGARQAKTETVRLMLTGGKLSVVDIAQYSGLSVSEVEALKKE